MHVACMYVRTIQYKKIDYLNNVALKQAKHQINIATLIFNAVVSSSQKAVLLQL